MRTAPRGACQVAVVDGEHIFLLFVQGSLKGYAAANAGVNGVGGAGGAIGTADFVFVASSDEEHIIEGKFYAAADVVGGEGVGGEVGDDGEFVFFLR